MKKPVRHALLSCGIRWLLPSATGWYKTNDTDDNKDVRPGPNAQMAPYRFQDNELGESGEFRCYRFVLLNPTAWWCTLQRVRTNTPNESSNFTVDIVKNRARTCGGSFTTRRVPCRIGVT